MSNSTQPVNFEMMYDDFDIDIATLETEWQRQARLNFTYGKNYAEAVRKRDDFKRKAELKLNENIDFVINHPEDYNLSAGQRNSSTLVKAMASTDQDYQKLLIQLAEAEEEVNTLMSAVYSMAQRKASLEYLTKLFLANYYETDSKIPAEIMEKQFLSLDEQLNTGGKDADS